MHVLTGKDNKETKWHSKSKISSWQTARPGSRNVAYLPQKKSHQFFFMKLDFQKLPLMQAFKEKEDSRRTK